MTSRLRVLLSSFLLQDDGDGVIRRTPPHKGLSSMFKKDHGYSDDYCDPYTPARGTPRVGNRTRLTMSPCMHASDDLHSTRTQALAILDDETDDPTLSPLSLLDASPLPSSWETAFSSPSRASTVRRVQVRYYDEPPPKVIVISPTPPREASTISLPDTPNSPLRVENVTEELESPDSEDFDERPNSVLLRLATSRTNELSQRETLSTACKSPRGTNRPDLSKGQEPLRAITKDGSGELVPQTQEVTSPTQNPRQIIQSPGLPAWYKNKPLPPFPQSSEPRRKQSSTPRKRSTSFPASPPRKDLLDYGYNVVRYYPPSSGNAHIASAKGASKGKEKAMFKEPVDCSPTGSKRVIATRPSNVTGVVDRPRQVPVSEPNPSLSRSQSSTRPSASHKCDSPAPALVVPTRGSKLQRSRHSTPLCLDLASLPAVQNQPTSFHKLSRSLSDAASNCKNASCQLIVEADTPSRHLQNVSKELFIISTRVKGLALEVEELGRI
ncbi:hypothetical protein FA15DRAFT_756732 [Coprinopsis marcescibilis]|uniref:Uncharacterized protein n=1 Tax=Coprinopsis marcescibilis TaxID=230819 RepID=A0A5C3KWE4_COPMA|nr:hypothetical protein FA15DRAFT_756732 [Coprinopsis marcescibilis]